MTKFYNSVQDTKFKIQFFNILYLSILSLFFAWNIYTKWKSWKQFIWTNHYMFDMFLFCHIGPENVGFKWKLLITIQNGGNGPKANCTVPKSSTSTFLYPEFDIIFMCVSKIPNYRHQNGKQNIDILVLSPTSYVFVARLSVFFLFCFLLNAYLRHTFGHTVHRQFLMKAVGGKYLKLQSLQGSDQVLIQVNLHQIWQAVLENVTFTSPNPTFLKSDGNVTF